MRKVLRSVIKPEDTKTSALRAPMIVPYNFGITITELMVALAASGLVVLLMQSLLGSVLKSAGSIEIDAEIAEIATELSSRIQCEKTYAINAINSNTGAGPASNAQIQLVDKLGNNILRAHSIGGMFAPYKLINNDWFADTRWTGKSIALSIAKRGKNGSSWAKDPYTGQQLDFAASRNVIYSDAPTAVQLCPISNSSKMLSVRVRTTMVTIAPLTGAVPPLSKIGVMDAGPVYLNKGCHYFCTSSGYSSGIGVGSADGTFGHNSSGVYTYTAFADGQGIVDCRCFI